MYQAGSKPIDTQTTDVDILREAITIVSQSGIDALTVRALAERCGMGPSSISHRFGSKNELLKSVSDQVDQELVSVWANHIERLPTDDVDARSFSGLLLGLLIENAVHHRDVLRFAWTMDVDRLRANGDRVTTAAELERQAFWDTLIEHAQLPSELAPGLAKTLVSLEHILLVEPPKTESIAWCRDAIERLVDRLLRKVPSSVGSDSPWRRGSERLRNRPEATASAGSTRQKIITTAKAIICESGYRDLSHREIALRGGFSLSSTTHHFRSLVEIMGAAFWSLYDDAVSEAQKERTARHPDTILDYICEVLPAMSSITQSKSSPVVAFEELMLLSAQREELRALGWSIFAGMGETTYTMLKPIEGGEAFTRLDAHLFRHALRGQFLMPSGSDMFGSEDLHQFLKHLFAE